MGKPRKEPICDMNCFNCIHPDCINNGRETKQEKEWTSAKCEPWKLKIQAGRLRDFNF